MPARPRRWLRVWRARRRYGTPRSQSLQNALLAGLVVVVAVVLVLLVIQRDR